MAKKADGSGGFNSPFRALKAKVPPAAASPPRLPGTPAPPPPRAPVGKSPGPGREPGTDEQRLFEQAMRGVVPLAATERTRRAATAPSAAPSRATSAATARREDAIADADLAELVSRPGRLTVEEVGEGVAAWAAGVDKRLLRRLRAGDYAVDAQVDLHGLSRDQASAALDRVLRRSFTDGQRCLLVIHGRGLNSGDEGPVLRDAVRAWLGEGPLARLVLAFASAPPEKGGTGAVVVLLRRQRAG